MECCLSSISAIVSTQAALVTAVHQFGEQVPLNPLQAEVLMIVEACTFAKEMVRIRNWYSQFMISLMQKWTRARDAANFQRLWCSTRGNSFKKNHCLGWGVLRAILESPKTTLTDTHTEYWARIPSIYQIQSCFCRLLVENCGHGTECSHHNEWCTQPSTATLLLFLVH